MIALGLLLACSEYTVHEPPLVPPAQPPGEDLDELGRAPDWTDCHQGFLGTYANLSPDHPDVRPAEDAPAPEGPEGLDWWDDTVFERFDPSLDFGEGWWPVDEGVEGDPDFFAVRWVAWIRARSDRLTFVVGASDDLWLSFNREVVLARPGPRDFAPERVELEPDNAQFPVEVHFAHRAGARAAMRLRLVEGDATICLPEFDD